MVQLPAFNKKSGYSRDSGIYKRKNRFVSLLFYKRRGDGLKQGDGLESSLDYNNSLFFNEDFQ